MVYPSYKRTKVFISYSHKDVRYLDQLVEHLTYYERNNLIEFWSDKKIAAGAQWHDEIKQAIEATKVAVLLISPSFLASKFIAENELPPLLQAAEKEGAIIMPVMVRSSNFEDTELANFQAVNSPSLPVAKMKGYQRDEFWAKVVREIKKAVSPQSVINPVQTSHVVNETKPMNTDMRQFKPGDKVCHATFGQGTVIASSIRQDDELVRVQFNREHSQKLLSSDYLKQDQPSSLMAQAGSSKYEHFNRGDKVRHDTFGEGVVLKSRFEGQTEFVEVKFQGNGVKRLSLDYTLLVKI